MARTVIAGNWKMNKTVKEAVAFVSELREALAGLGNLPEIIVAPPFTALSAVSEAIGGSSISLAAQNIHEAEKGAFTGEISAEMVREAGCHFVIIGHSERRTLFGETNERINKKLLAALKAGLEPIFCVGETLPEREGKRVAEVIEKQLKEGLNNLDDGDIGRVIVAYEPVWAIGTGKTASPAEAQDVHSFIRSWIVGLYGKELAAETVILYGGSVTPGNISDLMSQADVNGALVGGASLNVETFTKIVRHKLNQGV